MKRKSGLYDYLEQTGVLTDGSPKAITEVKQSYWKAVRKAWRKKQREECKSYTVFFTPSEQTKINKTVSTHNISTTKFIKQAALSKATNTVGVDARIIGQIRQLFFEAYNRSKSEASENILTEIIELETSVLEILKQV
ncbi:MAG: hypothetical protein HEQ40_12215 [Lacibacter sp.]|jgi:hypothetical protein